MGMSTMVQCLRKLRAEISRLEDQANEMQEKLNSFCSDNQVVTFKNGSYTDEIRMVYEDLLTHGVGTANVEMVIRKVLTKLANVDCDRLQKETFAKYMLIEARGLSQLQCCEILLNENCENNTMSNDGTKKFTRDFTTFDITTNDGTELCLGVRETASGTAECTLHVLK